MSTTRPWWRYGSFLNYNWPVTDPRTRTVNMAEMMNTKLIKTEPLDFDSSVPSKRCMNASDMLMRAPTHMQSRPRDDNLAGGWVQPSDTHPQRVAAQRQRQLMCAMKDIAEKDGWDETREAADQWHEEESKPVHTCNEGLNDQWKLKNDMAMQVSDAIDDTALRRLPPDDFEKPHLLKKWKTPVSLESRSAVPVGLKKESPAFLKPVDTCIRKLVPMPVVLFRKVKKSRKSMRKEHSPTVSPQTFKPASLKCPGSSIRPITRCQFNTCFRRFPNKYHWNSRSRADRLFQCTVCDKAFTLKCILREHMRRHTGERPYQCSVCCRGFTTESGLTRHARIHTGEKPFTCRICGKKFGLRCTLQKHALTHSAEKKPHECSKCGKTFTRKFDLDVHGKTHSESEERQYSCAECQKSFASKGSYRNHVREIHRSERTFPCSKCDMTFSRFPELAQHRTIHRGEKVHKCPTCDKRFARRFHLQCHVKMHTGETPFHCSKCPKSFVHLASLTIHLRTHAGEKLYQCSVCSKSFTLKSYLYKHEKRHIIPEEVPLLQCYKCGKIYRHKYSWKLHVEACASGDDLPSMKGDFKCDLCGKGFSRNTYLRRHILTHDDDRRYPCTICDKVYRQPQSLRVHVRTHTGEKPYKCVLCGRGFVRKQYVAEHMKTHSEDRPRPFECPVCKKTFSKAFYLNEHANIHTGEKPYSCDICGKTFAAHGTRNRHLKTHSGERSFFCLICGKAFAENAKLRRHILIHNKNKTN